MSKGYTPVSAENHQYLLANSLREDAVLASLRERTRDHEYADMITPPEQTQFLTFLLKLIKAKRVIEVGVFTGYTTLAMAQALPDEGEVIGCDKNAEWVSIALPFWQQAGVRDKIQLCIEDARITLQNLLDEGQANSFDFIYVDADKIHYQDYLQLGLQLIHADGLLVFDNVLRVGSGEVRKREVATTRALYEFNRLVQADESLDVTMLPMGYGVSLVRKS